MFLPANPFFSISSLAGHKYQIGLSNEYIGKYVGKQRVYYYL